MGSQAEREPSITTPKGGILRDKVERIWTFSVGLMLSLTERDCFTTATASVTYL